MKLYKQPNGKTWSMRFVFEGRRIERSTGFTNKRKAEAYAEAFRTRLRNEGVGFLYVSPAYEQIWGRESDDIYSQPDEWYEFIFPQDRQHVREAYAGLMRDRSEIEVEYRIIRPDGEQRWVRARGFQVKGSSGEVIRLAGIVSDITEKKQAEAEIELTLQRLKDAQRIGKMGDWGWELATGLITWSPQTFKILGRDPSLGPPKNYEENEALYDAESVALMSEKVDAAIATGEPQDYELVALHPDGQRVSVQAMAATRKDETGKVVALYGTLQDITERKRAEAALRVSEFRYQSLFENMLEGYAYCQTIFEKDRLVDLVYTEVNGAFETLTGLEDVVGKRISELIPGVRETHREFLDVYERVALSGEPERFETYIQQLGVWLSITAYSSNRESFVAVFDNITERKLAEASVADSRERLRLAAQSVKLGIWDWDVVENIIEWDDRMYELYGISPEAFGGAYEAWQQGLHPDDRKTGDDNIKAALSGERPFSNDFRVLWPNGEAHNIEARALVQRDDAGNPIRMIGVNWDITARKSAENELQELTKRTEIRERMLTNMLSSISDLVHIYDRRGRFMFVNQPLLALWDLSLDDVMGKNFYDIGYPPELAERLLTQIESVFRTKKPITDETPFTGADGKPGYYEYIFSPAIGPDGKVEFVAGSTRDVTERKRAEEKLRWSEENLARSQQIAHLGSWDLVVPETGDINEGRLRWSDEVFRIFGYEPGQIEITNDAFFNAVHPDDRADVTAAMAEALREGSEYRIDHRILLPNGSERFVHEHSEVVRNTDGEIVKMVGTIQDITSQKQMGEQLRQSQKMEAVGVLAGGIAHDFNNLLTAINGYSDLTLRKMAPDDPLRSNLAEIKDAGSRAAELTTQLLAFSRKQVLKSAVISLNSVVANVENMLRRIIRENIELRVVLDPELANVRADPGQIEQVIMNLVVNARDAMPGGGTLTIETDNVNLSQDYVTQHHNIPPGEFVRLTVTDSGEGMDAETRPHIFEPFFTTKEVGKGTGLGLSMVYGIVKQSGGDIMVYSEIGHGTTFKIYLPCIDEAVQKLRSTDDRNQNYSGTETILLVEDEEIVRKLVCEILSDWGYDVLEAANGPAALAILDTYTEPIHLLLTDVIMPKMGGSELSTEIVKRLPDIKVIFMSGYTDDSIAGLDIPDNDIAFIEKPFTPDALARKVREVLESR